MKQPRRRAVLLAALLMAVSLGIVPREGSTRTVGPQILPGDPCPTPEMGPPETPPDGGLLVSCRVWLSSALLTRGLQVNLAIVVGVPKRPSDTQLLRSASRAAVNP
jgi:hypothetical protein